MLLLTCAGLGHNCSRVSGAQAFKEISASKTATGTPEHELALDLSYNRFTPLDDALQNGKAWGVNTEGCPFTNDDDEPAAAGEPWH